MTGPAWDRLVASTRTTEHGAQLYREAYEAGLADALAIPLDTPAYDVRRMLASALATGEARGAWGRGSRARYRRAVVRAIERVERIVADLCFRDGDAPMPYVDTISGHHVVRAGDVLARHDRAAERLWSVLQRLDAGGR